MRSGCQDYITHVTRGALYNPGRFVRVKCRSANLAKNPATPLW